MRALRDRPLERGPGFGQPAGAAGGEWGRDSGRGQQAERHGVGPPGALASLVVSKVGGGGGAAELALLVQPAALPETPGGRAGRVRCCPSQQPGPQERRLQPGRRAAALRPQRWRPWARGAAYRG